MTVHNRRETTLKCLNRLHGQASEAKTVVLDIYMTDDGCTDGTAEAVRNGFPKVTIISGDGQNFWNRGMYAAWQEAATKDYDYYFWVNDDTFIGEHTLSDMLDSSLRHADEAIIVSSTVASDGSGKVTYGGWKHGEVIPDLTREHECDNMNGNLVIIPRAVFNKLGFNDPYYRHALGDMDYGLRAVESGIKIVQISGAGGVCDLHEHPVIWMDPSQPFRKRWDNFFHPLGNNPFEFFHYKKRHFGFWAAISSLITNILHFLFPALWLKKTNKTTI